MQGFMVKYNLSVNRGGDFSDEPQGADLARQKTWEVPLQHNYYLQVPKYAAKRKVVGVKMEYQLYTRTIAAKRESCAKHYVQLFLLAVTLQMAIWFIWNSSLYVVSLIYRLNRSKVYMWSDFCKCGDEGVKWDDCSEKRNVRTSIMRIFSFGCNSTNGYMVYVE